MTADEALQRLLEGNQRFADDTHDHPRRDGPRRAEQAGEQTPFAVILGCADSRVPPEIVFDQGIGDLFVVRVAGNTAVDPTVLGSLEFGVSVLGCPLLLVLGHDQCGALEAAVHAVVDDEPVAGRLAGVIRPLVARVQEERSPQPSQLLDAAIVANVRHQVVALGKAFDAVAVVGAHYALGSGRVELVSDVRAPEP